MPRNAPRSLCLPELVANPQTRADYVEANPPKYGPDSSRPSSISDPASSPIPPSPTSLKSFDSHRTSGTTLASLASPVATASTRTSLSVHNLPWNGEGSSSKRTSTLSGILSRAGIGTESVSSSSSKGWTFGSISSGLADAVADKKPRASWSSAFSGTKSWFGGVAAEAEVEKPSLNPNPNQKEIKLSPSMIAATAAAAAAEAPKAVRPCSYPFPATKRTPRVGTGLQYYTEQNPSPPNLRVQIPDPIDPSDVPPSGHSSIPPLPPSQTISLPVVTLATEQERISDSDATPTRPLTHEGDSNVPDIRVTVSSGDT